LCSSSTHVACVPAGTIRRLYLQHLIANTPPDKLREALESLATPEVRKRIQLDINSLLDHPDEIVPYFTTKDADEVLLLVGTVLKGQKVDPFNLSPAQQDNIKQALETNKVDNWLARKYKKSKADRDEVRHKHWTCYNTVLAEFPMQQIVNTPVHSMVPCRPRPVPGSAAILKPQSVGAWICCFFCLTSNHQPAPGSIER
jgi:hypothetical protein